MEGGELSKDSMLPPNLMSSGVMASHRHRWPGPSGPSSCLLHTCLATEPCDQIEIMHGRWWQWWAGSPCGVGAQPREVGWMRGLLTLQDYSNGGASLQAGHLQEADTAHRLVQSPPFTGGETNLATQSALAKAMHTAGGRASSTQF